MTSSYPLYKIKMQFGVIPYVFQRFSFNSKYLRYYDSFQHFGGICE